MKPLLHIENLHLSVNEKPILHNLNLTVNAGEIHVVMGRTAPENLRLLQRLSVIPSFKLTKAQFFLKGN